ncbi:MAG: hypothetical protein CMH54_02360 [Myxococcales bacterium]|nr:hypothetical protein [Myxococcales bacterium]
MGIGKLAIHRAEPSMKRIKNLVLFTLCAPLLACPTSEYSIVLEPDFEVVTDANEDIREVEGTDRDVPILTDAVPDVEEERDVVPDVEKPKDNPVYDPDWTEHNNPVVENCMELIPEICNKLWDCEIPGAELLAAGCPQLADAGQDVVRDGCEELVLENASDPAARFMANAAFTVLESCIEDYECTQENIQELIGNLASSGQGFGGDGLAGALPQLLGLIMEECGGSLGFPGFGSD